MQSINKYNTDNKLIKDLFPDKDDFKNRFINPVAEYLFRDMQRFSFSDDYPSAKVKNFSSLVKAEKSFWYNAAAAIPEKLRTLNLFIRPVEDFCRTCIITDKEVASLARKDQEILLSHKSFQSTIKDKQKFCININYLIPAVLKKIGFEVIRYEEVFEINIVMIRKLARAIHSKYLHEIRNQSTKSNSYVFYNPGDSTNLYTSDFDDLPAEIKNSNIDNAAHIPTKLLSIGYKIKPAKKGFKPFALHLDKDEIETMARVEHIRWSWEKRINGWTFGNIKDDIKKTHPSQIPYDK